MVIKTTDSHAFADFICNRRKMLDRTTSAKQLQESTVLVTAYIGSYYSCETERRRLSLIRIRVVQVFFPFVHSAFRSDDIHAKVAMLS